MRYGIILAAALAVMSATAACADDEWCGYSIRDKSLIECGYSSAAECENAVGKSGKGGMCFVDPDYAFNAKRTTPVFPARHSAGHG